MAELGLCSRREADSYIEKGWVKVDGQVAVLGQKVTPGQRIELVKEGHQQQSSRATILLNKPVGYVSGQAEEGYQPAVVLVTQDNHWVQDRSGVRFSVSHRQGLAPAGRLVLTQDGRVAKTLIGENSDIEKEYLVRVEGKLSADNLHRLNHGLKLDGKALRPAQVSWQNEDQLRFILREGKKRQIRRMCEMVSLTVTGLKRVRIGGILLGGLPQGQWRYLGEDERFNEPVKSAGDRHSGKAGMVNKIVFNRRK